MKKSRQVSRAEARRAAKLKQQSKKNSREHLDRTIIELVKLVTDMQVSLNTMYQVMIDKEAMTAEEFQAKHAEIVKAMYPPKEVAETTEKEVADAEV